MTIVGILCATVLAPAGASANTDLVVGETAVIAFANGDDVRLREAPGYNASVLAMVSEGSLVDVLDGPLGADDGSLWYNVAFNGQPGFIVADYLALPTADGGAEPVVLVDPEVAEEAPEAVEAALAVIGVAVIAGTNGDGVRCRTGASSDSTVITVLPEGTTVELTGGPIDVWQPVNCGGGSGFVHTDFVSFDGSTPSTDDAATTDGEAAEFGAVAVTGVAMVSSTSSGGLRCRARPSTNASVLTVLSEGSTLELRGEADGSWQPVVCAGANGYVHTDFVTYDGTGGEATGGEDEVAAADSGSVTGEATIVDTNGDGLRCRSNASFDASVITVVREGSSISLRGNAQGEWQPVVCGGSRGFVHVDFLSYDGGGGGDDVQSDDVGGDEATGSAVVTGTNGDGLRCRASAGFNASVVTVLREGSSVDLRGDAQGEWQPVFCAGSKGFVHADFLGSGGGSSDDGDDDDGGSSGGGSNSSFSAGDGAEVSGTNGDGVRLRSDAGFNASVIAVVGEGKIVTVGAGSTGDWVAVTYNGSSGFIHMDFLAPSDGAPPAGNDDGDDDDDSGGGSSGGGMFDSGDNAEVQTSLNLRYEASFSSGIAAVAPAGTVVEVTGGPSNGFYPVSWDGLDGYMHGDYLTPTDAPASDRGGSGQNGNDDGTSGGGNNQGSASGSAMVNFAMQYVGYPYVWATHGPGSFDCSGFTYWVALNVLGIDIGTGSFSQPNYGTPVSRGNLQPGDLVFFQNTYTWGLSHVGIYIGNGQFVHAENESTGVRVSDLNSSYYSSRWYGATRLA